MANCSCMLGVRDSQKQSTQPEGVTWTELLATNVIAGIAHIGEYILTVDCRGTPATAQSCRAHPEQLHFVSMVDGGANDTASGISPVQMAGSAIIEAAIQITAAPAALNGGMSDDSSNDLQSGALAVRVCSGTRVRKWAARALLVLATVALTSVAGSQQAPK